MVDQVRVITGLLREATEKVVTAISVNVTAELIENTPVDTGWARANWIPAIGTPFEEAVTGNPDPAIVPNQRGLQQSGLASVITGYSLSRGPVFVTNNVPYILSLNDGSSAQAPAAFVQAAIAAGVAGLGDRIPQ